MDEIFGKHRVPLRPVFPAGVNVRDLAVRHPGARLADPEQRLHAIGPPAP